MGNKISSILGLLFAIFIMKEGYQLDVGGFGRPGPGFFVFFGGILLAIFSAILLIQSSLGKEKIELTRDTKVENPMTVGYIVGVLILYAILFETLGFILCTFFLIIFLLWLFDKKKWWYMFLIAALISSACFILFDILLGTTLPMGTLELFFN